MNPLRALLLGGCSLHVPISDLLVRGERSRLIPAPLSVGSGTPGIYTFDEIFQLIALYRRQVELPDVIKLLAGISPDFEPLPGAGTFEEVDVALVELNSPHELSYRGFSVNRGAVLTHVYNPLRDSSEASARLAHAWYEKGVIGGNPDLQRTTAEQLITSLPPNLENPSLVADVLLGLTAGPTDIPKAMLRLRDLINKPMGVIVYTFSYMPDGRPIHWPKNFDERVTGAAKELGLPIMEPWRLVQQHGVKEALKGDLRHYRDEFLPAMADAIVEFARRVTDAGVAGGGGTRPSPASTEECGRPLTGVAAAARVDSSLVPLHQRRVADLGVDGSGLFDHYKRLLDTERIAGSLGTGVLAQMIVQSLPRFDGYHVLRAGLGELAFVLATMGLRVQGCEPNGRRFGAVEAGLQSLAESAPEIADRISISRETIPAAPSGDRTLCVANHLIGFAADEEEGALAALSAYGALLIEPRIFLRSRPTIDEQEDVVHVLRQRGFTFTRHFPRLGIVYCAKPEAPPIPTVMVHAQLPSTTSIVDALNGLPLEESGRLDIKPGAVGVRDYPFPFKSALAVATGVAWQSPAHFRQMRDHLCGTAQSPFGPGLGLEIGGAFTLSRDGTSTAVFGTRLPVDPKSAGGDEALLVELGRVGWIDTLREVVIDDTARGKLDALGTLGLVPAVGIDVEGHWPSLRFVSDGQLLERGKFGDHVDFRFDARFVEAIRTYPWEQWKKVFPANRERVVARFNSILQPVEGEDDVLPFKRFRGSLPPTWTTFPPQLTTDRLDYLMGQRAAVIVELEASTWSLVGAAEGRDRRRQLSLGEMFDEHTLPCWEDIAERWRDQRLLVATVGRLLNWLRLRQRLQVRTRRGGDKWVLTLSTQEVRALSVDELNGLALLVPEDAPEIVVVIEGSSAALPVCRAPDPSMPKHHAVYLPWLPLAWPHEQRNA